MTERKKLTTGHIHLAVSQSALIMLFMQELDVNFINYCPNFSPLEAITSFIQ